MLSERQLEFRRAVRTILKKECPPALVNQWESTGVYPHQLYDLLANLGCIALPFPPEYGGLDGGPVDMCLLGEDLGSVGFDVAAGFGISVFCGLNLLRHGTKEQREDYLPELLSGHLRFAVAISEPDSGSDAASLKTRAVRSGGSFVLTGEKMYTTGAHLPGTVIQVACRTDPHASKREGISVILVPNDSPGVNVRPMEAIGRNIVKTTSVFLDDVEVPASNLLGEVNGGWTVIRSGLELERLFAAAASVGAAQAAFDETLAYAKERHQFGQPIGEFQAIAHLFADLQTQIDAARLLTFEAARLKEDGEPCVRQISESKLMASETFSHVTRSCLQVMGGFGYMRESSIQRHFRDAVSTTITAGTSQIQRTIIARNLGLKAP